MAFKIYASQTKTNLTPPPKKKKNYANMTKMILLMFYKHHHIIYMHKLNNFRSHFIIFL